MVLRFGRSVPSRRHAGEPRRALERTIDPTIGYDRPPDHGHGGAQRDHRRASSEASPGRRAVHGGLAVGRGGDAQDLGGRLLVAVGDRTLGLRTRNPPRRRLLLHRGGPAVDRDALALLLGAVPVDERPGVPGRGRRQGRGAPGGLRPGRAERSGAQRARRRGAGAERGGARVHAALLRASRNFLVPDVRGLRLGARAPPAAWGAMGLGPARAPGGLDQRPHGIRPRPLPGRIWPSRSGSVAGCWRGGRTRSAGRSIVAACARWGSSWR